MCENWHMVWRWWRRAPLQGVQLHHTHHSWSLHNSLVLVLSRVEVWIEQFQLIVSSPPCPSSTVASACRRWLPPFLRSLVCLRSKSPLVTSASWHPLPKVNKCYCFSLPPPPTPLLHPSNNKKSPARKDTNDLWWCVCAVIGPKMCIGGDQVKDISSHKSQRTSGIKTEMSIYEQVEPLRS